MNPIVVLAKGPSARHIQPGEGYDVATCNNTLWLCPNPTYAFFNDVDLIWLTKKEHFEEVENMVVPTYLHSHWGRVEGTVDCTEDETHFYELSKIFPGWLDHINYNVYELHDGDNVEIFPIEESYKNYVTLISTSVMRPGRYQLTPEMRILDLIDAADGLLNDCLLYTSPSPRDATLSRFPSSA